MNYKARALLAVGVLLAIVLVPTLFDWKEDNNTRLGEGNKYTIGLLSYNQILRSIFFEFRKDMSLLAEKGGFQVEYVSVDIVADEGGFEETARGFKDANVDLVITGQAAAQLIRSVVLTPIIVAYSSNIAEAEKAKRESGDINMAFVDSGSSLISGDRLALISQAFPDAKSVLVLRGADGNTFSNPGPMEIIKSVARAKQLTVTEKVFNTREELNRFFLSFDFSDVDVIFRYPDPFISANMDLLFAMTRQPRVNKPLVVRNRTELEAGGVFAYGTSLENFGEVVAGIAEKVLNNKADLDNLPIQRPYDHQLGVNKLTASLLGISIPQSFIDGADYVIE